MGTLVQILREQWEWRRQIVSLGVFDLRKVMRGAVLGPLWLFAKPAVYILVFWFALDVGLRSGTTEPGMPPYFLWLVAGLIPWFYMQDLVGVGADVFHRYSYLVKKIKFPLCGIPVIYSISTLIIQCGLIVALLVIYFLCGQGLSIYLLQLPIAMAIMFVFFVAFSLMVSCLSGVSKDFRNLMKTLNTPLFWLSGVIFPVDNLGPMLRLILDFNPITFIIKMYRCAFYSHTWITEDFMAVIGFAIVFVVTVVAATVIYKRTREEVADVL